MTSLTRLLSASALALALASGAARAQQVVGAVGAANAAPTGHAPGRPMRVLTPGGDIFFKDRITTKRGGSAQLTFLDRSTLSVGENSNLVIDEFVYNPDAKGSMSASLSKGVMRFVGGDISHSDGVTVKTPVVTIGIRGGIGTIGYVEDAAGLGAIPGVPSTFKGGTIVVNGYGQMTVRNGASEVLLSRPGFAVFVGSAREAIAAPVRFDLKAAQALMRALASKGGQHGGASRKAVAAVAGADIGHFAEAAVALPRPPRIDALDFTSVVASGNALARNQSQANQASQLATQLHNARTTAAAPTTTPVTTPVATPVATPVIKPATTPVTAPVTPPAATAVTAPVTPPVAPTVTTPVATPAAAPAPPPVTAPVTPPVATPVTPPVATPVTAPAPPPVTTPVTPPVATPVTAPVTSPVTTPVTMPVTTPVTTPPSNPTPANIQTVYNINVSVVRADVIYAHIIEAGHIQAARIIQGASYGSMSGTSVNGNNYSTTGQLNAHDIHAGTVIANIIYVDFIEH